MSEKVAIKHLVLCLGRQIQVYYAAKDITVEVEYREEGENGHLVIISASHPTTQVLSTRELSFVSPLAKDITKHMWDTAHFLYQKVLVVPCWCCGKDTHVADNCSRKGK